MCVDLNAPYISYSPKCYYGHLSGESRTKIDGGVWIGMESNGRWSTVLESLNPKCHYEYQEMRGGGGGASHPIHNLDPPLHLWCDGSSDRSFIGWTH